MIKVKCEICNQEITKNNYSKHLRRHMNHPESFESKYKLTHDGLQCQFCGKEWKNRNSLCNHERQCKLNPNRQDSGFVLYNQTKVQSWNKGLTKETDERVAKGVLTRETNFKLGKFKIIGHKHSDATKQILREARYNYILKNPDALNSTPKRGHSGYYKGIHCDSSWELAFLVYNLENNVNILRNKTCFEYTYDDKKHLYYPDFIINGEYYEIKNYNTPIVEAKTSQFPNDLKLHILYKNDIIDCLNYCVNKYGKHFWDVLYDIR